MMLAIIVTISSFIAFCLGILAGRWFADKEEETTRKTLVVRFPQTSEWARRA